jgi:hypothetical protein
MNKTTFLSLLAATAASSAAGMAYGAESLEPYAHQARVVQELKAFDNPEGAIFSEDGRYVFISNAAELGMPDKGFHFTHNGGYISKLSVQKDGSLKMENEKLIDGLTGPVGMAVSTVATQKFPKGTIFLAEASAPLAEADGTEVTDPKAIDPRIVAFNADGKILGAIKLGQGSQAQKTSGATATLANALAFDKEGNLYLAETGIGGGQFKPKIATHGGGIYLFPVSSLDALADNREATLFYLPVPEGGPDGIEVAPDGVVNFNTVGLVAGLKDPAEGGMYRVRRSDFESGTLPKPFNRNLGALDGLDYAGTARLDTEIKNSNNIVVTPFWSDKSYALTYDKQLKLNGPADIAVHKMDDGSYLVVIPQLSATSRNSREDPVAVIRLPADFDKFDTMESTR